MASGVLSSGVVNSPLRKMREIGVVLPLSTENSAVGLVSVCRDLSGIGSSR